MFSTSAMRQRHRLVAVADEAGHRRGVAHGGPRLVGEVHADQDVAGEDGPLDHLALAVLDLGDLLGGDHDLVDVVLHVEGDDAVLEVRLHPVLHAGVGVHDEPVAGLGPQLAAERLERVVRSSVVVLVVDVVLGGRALVALGLGQLARAVGLVVVEAQASSVSSSVTSASSAGRPRPRGRRSARRTGPRVGRAPAQTRPAPSRWVLLWSIRAAGSVMRAAAKIAKASLPKPRSSSDTIAIMTSTKTITTMK